MERHKHKETSIYSFLKNKQNSNYYKAFNTHSEIDKMHRLVYELQYKITKPKEDITDTLKNLEYYLPLGNNNKELSDYLYNSKLFLNIIETVSLDIKEATMLKLLVFIEKIIKGNRFIAKYMSRNSEFLKRILKLMKINVKAF
jgi:hypothetical protein